MGQVAVDLEPVVLRTGGLEEERERERERERETRGGEQRD